MDLKGIAPGGSAGVPAHVLAERFEFLRATWLEVAADVAPGSGQVAELLGRRLDQLAPFGVANEFDLLNIAEDAAQVSLQVTDAESARTLSKRLRRTVYEYLLAVDAVAETGAPRPVPVVSVPANPSRRGAVMIGLEEVAAQPWPEAVRPTVIAGALSAAVDATADLAADTGADGMAEAANVARLEEGVEESAADTVAAEPRPAAKNGDVHEVPETPVALLPPVTDPVAGAEATEGAVAAAGPRPQLTVVPGALPRPAVPAEPAAPPDREALRVPGAFRRAAPLLPPAPVVIPSYRAWEEVIAAAGADTVEAVAPPPEALPPAPPNKATPPPEAAPRRGLRALRAAVARASALGGGPPKVSAPPVAPAAASPEDPAGSPPVEVDYVSPTGGDSAGAGWPPVGEPVDARVDWDAARSWPDPALHPTEPAADHAGGWSIRKSPRQQVLSQRMAAQLKEAAVQAAVEAARVPDKGRKRRGDREPLNRDAIPLQVGELLHRKKGADAAVLLQRAAQEFGGRDLADLAVDAGDQLKGLGQARPAVNCYLAAWRADPLYEAPLWRLADTALSDHATELAVGYLERIADLMRARDDDDAAVAVYRKITAIAPERKDIRELLRHLHATGRLLD